MQVISSESFERKGGSNLNKGTVYGYFGDVISNHCLKTHCNINWMSSNSESVDIDSNKIHSSTSSLLCWRNYSWASQLFKWHKQ